MLAELAGNVAFAVLIMQILSYFFPVFGNGQNWPSLIGASILAASILPLSTAYSGCEFAGLEAAIDDPYSEARTFYLTYAIITMIGTALVLAPNAPLVTILVGTQVLNAVLLIPLLIAMVGLSRDRDLMGEFTATRRSTAVYALTTAAVVVCVVTLAVTELI